MRPGAALPGLGDLKRRPGQSRVHRPSGRASDLPAVRGRRGESAYTRLLQRPQACGSKEHEMSLRADKGP